MQLRFANLDAPNPKMWIKKFRALAHQTSLRIQRSRRPRVQRANFRASFLSAQAAGSQRPVYSGRRRAPRPLIEECHRVSARGPGYSTRAPLHRPESWRWRVSHKLDSKIRGLESATHKNRFQIPFRKARARKHRKKPHQERAVRPRERRKVTSSSCLHSEQHQACSPQPERESGFGRRRRRDGAFKHSSTLDCPGSPQSMRTVWPKRYSTSF